MKKSPLFLFVAISAIILAGCASAKVTNPAEIHYKEISAKEYFNARESDLYSPQKGYKISDVYIFGVANKKTETEKEDFIEISEYFAGTRKTVNATEYISNMNQIDPTFADRIKSVSNNSKYNGHYTVYLYGESQGDFFTGYTMKTILYKIEGIPSQEQLDADAAGQERIKAEEERLAAEKKNRLDAKGKEIAKGYTYHGIDEDARNRNLFTNGALEEGHAYYISKFVVKYNGRMASIENADGFFFSSQSPAVYVDYINQKVKGEIIDEGTISFFGQTAEIPVTVVVTGGNGITKTPVVLGLIKTE